jgi:hypothetical protein
MSSSVKTDPRVEPGIGDVGEEVEAMVDTTMITSHGMRREVAVGEGCDDATHPRVVKIFSVIMRPPMAPMSMAATVTTE